MLHRCLESHESAERRKGQKFLEAKAALVEAMELDPAARHLLNARETLRDVLTGIGVPEKWTRDEREVDELAQADQKALALSQQLEQAGTAAAAAADLGSAAKDFGAEQAAPGV